MTLIFLGLVGAYLAGAIPFGIIVGRGIFGVDPRTVGSGNIGAANSMRALGPLGATLVLAGDVVKGVVPTLLAAHWLPYGHWAIAAAGFVTIIGYNWAIFLHFKRGQRLGGRMGVHL